MSEKNIQLINHQIIKGMGELHLDIANEEEIKSLYQSKLI